MTILTETARQLGNIKAVNKLMGQFAELQRKMGPLFKYIKISVNMFRSYLPVVRRAVLPIGLPLRHYNGCGAKGK